MKKILSSQQGITLVEVLATLAIMAIISGGIYSVFITGLKLYQKTGIEAQLRDDADYVATMILNEMYNNPPNYITTFEKSGKIIGIEMIRLKPKSVEGYLVEESTKKEQRLLIYYESEKFYIEKFNWITEADGTETVKTEKVELAADGSKFTEIDDETSFISYTCTKPVIDSNKNCQHGRIELNIVIADDNEKLSNLLKTEPLKLESSFGF